MWIREFMCATPMNYTERKIIVYTTPHILTKLQGNHVMVIEVGEHGWNPNITNSLTHSLHSLDYTFSDHIPQTISDVERSVSISVELELTELLCGLIAKTYTNRSMDTKWDTSGIKVSGEYTSCESVSVSPCSTSLKMSVYMRLCVSVWVCEGKWLRTHIQLTDRPML